MPMLRADPNSNHQIRVRVAVLLIGSATVSVAWLLTPRYGPWLCHGVAATVTLLSALCSRLQTFRKPQSGLALCGAAGFGIVFAGASWLLAPLAAARVPQLGEEIRALYLTLNHAPGPMKAAPILGLSVLVEELIWRGLVVDWLVSRKLSVSHVALLATAAYAMPIICSGSLLLFVIAIALGMALTLQRLHLQSWVPCYITHLTWNLLVFVVHPVL